MDKNSFDWKKAGIIGFIIYVASVPVMVWRSSKIGKLLSIVLLLFVIIKMVAYGSEKLSNSFFNIQSVFEARTSVKPLIKELAEVKSELVAQRKELNQFSEGLVRRYMKGGQKIDEEVAQKREEILTKIQEVEEGITLIREEERDSLKHNIIKLREDVKLKGHSIEEAVIREQVEGVANKFFLLTDEEKDRFNKDLEEIGFKVKKTEDKIVHIYSGSYGMATATAVTQVARLQEPYFVGASSDTISYRYAEDSN